MLMKKFITLLLVLTGMVSTVMADGTSVTLYYAITSSTVGSKTVQVQTNSNSGGWHGWQNMTKSTKTYYGYDIYYYTYTENGDKFYDIQFRCLNGSDQENFQWPLNNTSSNLSDYNGTMYVYSTGWREYNYNKSFTIHCKKNGTWIPSKAHNYYHDSKDPYKDGDGNVAEASFPGNNTSVNTLNSDWYDYTITGRPCTKFIFSDGNTGYGHQAGTNDIGDEKEYWVTYNGSETTCVSTLPAEFNYTRGITDGKFGTICLPYAATVTGATVFEITGKVMDGSTLKGINLSSVDNLTAGVAYIFKATSAELTATLSGNYTAAVTGGNMEGNLGASTKAPVDSYVVGTDNMIHKVTGSDVNVGQYKGWINMSVVPDAAARGLDFLEFDGGTTGIETVKANQTQNGEYFNLAGQRVAQPTKGLYIVNGKKVIIK